MNSQHLRSVMLITCNMARAKWYEGTAQLLSLTELNRIYFSFIYWLKPLTNELHNVINPVKVLILDMMLSGKLTCTSPRNILIVHATESLGFCLTKWLYIIPGNILIVPTAQLIRFCLTKWLYITSGNILIVHAAESLRFCLTKWLYITPGNVLTVPAAQVIRFCQPKWLCITSGNVLIVPTAQVIRFCLIK